jgi:phage terminase large subunit
MKTIRLQPKQQECLDHLKATGKKVPTMVAFGGARGGAKSATVRYTALLLAIEFPGVRIAIVRRVYGDVKVNHIDPILAEFPELRAYYSVSNAEIKIGKSVIEFVYAESASEVNRKFWGPEYAFVLLDQAEQFSGEEIRIIKTANRWPGRPAGFCKMGLFFNPGGIGTEFLRRVFYLKQYQDNEQPTDYVFIQAYGWDNYEWFRGQIDMPDYDFYKLKNEERFELFINQTQYGRELNALPQSLRAGHLLGSFESFAGQYFAGVWDESKIILTPQQCELLIQPWWVRWTATDWGFAHYAVHLWGAAGKVSPDQLQKILGVSCQFAVDIVIVYRELIARDTSETDLARLIVKETPEAERRHIQRHYLGPDAWSKRGAANTVAEQLTAELNRAQLPSPEPADNQRMTEGDRVGGWRLLWNGFQQTCSLFGNITVQPGNCLFVSANCPQTISSMPLLIHDNKHPGKLEDVLKVPGSLADDVGDCVRYLYKSYLDPRTAPREIIMRDIYESIPGDTSDAMTARAMAMRQFEAANPQRTSGATPRWRPRE